MSQVVATKARTIEDSVELTRPHLNTFMAPDTNVGPTVHTEYMADRRAAEMRIPNAIGAPSYQVTCCDEKLAALNESPLRPPAKAKRNDVPILDPMSGFVSVSGDVLLARKASDLDGQSHQSHHMPFMGKAKKEPHTTRPQHVHSVRSERAEAIDELRRTREGVADFTQPTLGWNTKMVSDGMLRSRLGGWTSDAPPKPELHDYDMKKHNRDRLAHDYCYKTSAQLMYEQVSWDSKLPDKLHAPVTTYEYGMADPVRVDKKAYGKKPSVSQSSFGMEWDRVQSRQSNFSTTSVDYGAPTKVAGHIPGYSGQYGGVNKLYMDEKSESFEPFTNLRTQQPKQPDPNHYLNKQNIPGYTGHIHNFKTTSVSHYDEQGRPCTTTAAFHKQMPSVGFATRRYPPQMQLS